MNHDLYFATYIILIIFDAFRICSKNLHGPTIHSHAKRCSSRSLW